MKIIKSLILDGKIPIKRKLISQICLYGVPAALTVFMVIIFLMGNSIDYVEGLGSLSMALLIALLVLKPLSKIFMDFGILRTFASYPKELGMMMFYFGLAHGLSYMPFNFKMFNAVPDYDPPLFIKFGFAALLVTAILFVTSNKFSMKKLGKNWFKLHKLIYLAFILTLLHVYYLDPEEGGGVLALLAVVILLKILSWKKVEVRLLKQK